MTEQPLLLAVKPIVTYPREAQVGKTYLMTIDLQPEEEFEWQYEEEEYPIYCSVNSSLFTTKPVGEPVIVLHRFGGSYGEAKFFLTAFHQGNDEYIRVTLVNKWGISIKSFKLKSINVIEFQNLTCSSISRESITGIEALKSKKSPYNFQSLQNDTLLSTAAIMAIGGAEDKVHSRLILHTFFEHCGGAEARIAIIPSASREPRIIGERYHTIFEEMGAKSIEVIDIREREQGADPTYQAYLETCTGVFITGGEQLRLYDLLSDTPVLEIIRTRAQQREIILAGTSAGTPVLGQYMIAGGGSGEPPKPSLVDMSVGLGILPEVILDTHFYSRNRFARLLSAVSQHPEKLGIGIDEDTSALLESDGIFHVIGKGAVTVVDPNEVTFNNCTDIDAIDCISIHNLRIHILTDGDRYDIYRRLIISANGKAGSLEAVSSQGSSRRRVQQSQKDSTSPAIMAIGGAEDKIHDRLILHTFLRRSGGVNARIAIIPSASREPLVIGERYRNLFEEMGAKSIEIIDIREREQTTDINWLAYLSSCTGVFITAGDQLRLCGLLADTPVLEKIQVRVRQGEVTLAGTSTGGLNVFGQYMIAGGGSGEPPNRSLVDLTTGFGIIPEAIWDAHSHNRNRTARLITAVAAHPDKLGIGIDEDTCAVWENANFFQVVGKGSVTVIDPTGVSFSNFASVTATAPISIHNLRVHVLTHGDQYDLNYREATSLDNNQSLVEATLKDFDQLEHSPSNLGYLQRLVDVISSDEFSIRSAMESGLVNVLYGKEVESYEIPDDNNQATVEAVGEIQTIDLDISVVEYFNNEKLVIPFKLQVECLLQYFIYKADYYALDEERSVSIDDWNDHYFMAEEYYPLEVEGLVAVTPDLESIESSELSDDDIMDLLADADISIESLTRIEVMSS